jgi:hypothetical protein
VGAVADSDRVAGGKAAGIPGAVLLLGQALGRGRSNLAVAGATLAMAAVFQPAQRRVQNTVDRRFNRRRYDAAKSIEAFSVRLRQQTDLETLSAELLAVVDQSMEPTSVSLWLRPPRGPHRLPSVNSRKGRYIPSHPNDRDR